jgi:predicted GNAT superfamily acetyltransferase
VAGAATAERRLTLPLGSTEHWRQAEAAANAAGVELEPLESLDDATSITDVSVATWGDFQLVPREMIRALQESGDVPWGAFHNGRMIGYVLGWLGIDEEGLHAHSHMLAVHTEWQSRGVGFALKLAQRAWALDRGVPVVRWTFDPILARNAYFNLAKLGAAADRFLPHFYGEMDDELNRGERSDRLLVRWDLASDASGPAQDEGVVLLDRAGPEDRPEPVPGEVPSAGPALVRIPADYPRLRATDPALADRWRDALGRALEEAFGAGLAVSGFTRTTTYVCS